MNLDPFLVRVTASKSVPYELLAYQRFLDDTGRAHSRDEAYLLFEQRVRFSPESDDVLVALPLLSAESSGSGTTVSHAQSGSTLALPSDVQTTRSILNAINGTRSVFGVQVAATVTVQQLDEFLAHAFGKVVFAPKTLERFESRISGTELVRFVGAPYEIQRAYWANMADCRERLLHTFARRLDLNAWLTELRLLHVVLLMGNDGRSFYRPHSPLGRRDARPGEFYTTPTKTLEEAGLCLLVDGPRVSAAFTGGDMYHGLLCASLDDAPAMAPARRVADVTRLDWGAICFGMARHDAIAAPWFCPARPLTLQHFEQLHRTFEACLESLSDSSEPAQVEALADFHWQFVRLHPFRCANQSLSMNIVNALRLRAGRQPIPHLLLDLFALRLTRDAYRRAFARAVRYWTTTDNDALARWRQLADRRAAVDRFVSRLGDFDNVEAAARFVRSSPEDAAVALLLD